MPQFAVAGQPDVVVHVHFGMSGKWSAVDTGRAPEATSTTRLQLEGHGIVSHLSAMTVAHGGPELFEAKRSALGEDPLRADADPSALWARVSKSSKSIGALLMDQSYFAGVGNIFRCEILLVAGVHPNVRGADLTRAQYDRIWAASVKLMERAFTLGSIVTVEKHEALAVGRPGLRRWLYNSAVCGKCGGRVCSWQIQSRTCYACTGGCQPISQPTPAEGEAVAGGGVGAGDSPRLFLSHCAGESLEQRLATPEKLRVGELREALTARGLPTSGKKALLVARLKGEEAASPPPPAAHGGEGASADDGASGAPSGASSSSAAAAPAGRGKRMRSANAAAADKAAVRESRAVEHVAEYEDLDEASGEEWLDALAPGGAAVPADGARKSRRS